MPAKAKNSEPFFEVVSTSFNLPTVDDPEKAFEEFPWIKFKDIESDINKHFDDSDRPYVFSVAYFTAKTIREHYASEEYTPEQYRLNKKAFIVEKEWWPVAPGAKNVKYAKAPRYGRENTHQDEKTMDKKKSRMCVFQIANGLMHSHEAAKSVHEHEQYVDKEVDWYPVKYTVRKFEIKGSERQISPRSTPTPQKKGGKANPIDIGVLGELTDEQRAQIDAILKKNRGKGKAKKKNDKDESSDDDHDGDVRMADAFPTKASHEPTSKKVNKDNSNKPSTPNKISAKEKSSKSTINEKKTTNTPDPKNTEEDMESDEDPSANGQKVQLSNRTWIGKPFSKADYAQAVAEDWGDEYLLNFQFGDLIAVGRYVPGWQGDLGDLSDGHRLPPAFRYSDERITEDHTLSMAGAGIDPRNVEGTRQLGLEEEMPEGTPWAGATWVQLKAAFNTEYARVAENSAERGHTKNILHGIVDNTTLKAIADAGARADAKLGRLREAAILRDQIKERRDIAMGIVNAANEAIDEIDYRSRESEAAMDVDYATEVDSAIRASLHRQKKDRAVLLQPHLGHLGR